MDILWMWSEFSCIFAFIISMIKYNLISAKALKSDFVFQTKFNLLMLLYLILILILSILLMIIFFSISKSSGYDNWLISIFECGFSSYFFSRYSFSSHYFVIALIFLFLDLELSMIMPYLMDFFCDFSGKLTILLFLSALLYGLLIEWKEGKLEWLY